MKTILIKEDRSKFEIQALENKMNELETYRLDHLKKIDEEIYKDVFPSQNNASCLIIHFLDFEQDSSHKILNMNLNVGIRTLEIAGNKNEVIKV